MTIYCLVEDGVIKAGPSQLPADWNGIINFNMVEDPVEHGWLPVSSIAAPSYDPATEKLTATLTIVGETVEQSFVKSGMTRHERDVYDPVPKRVSAAQALLVLDAHGLLDVVEAVIAGMPKYVQIWYNRANDWERYNPYVMGLGMELSLNDDQIDDMFRAAAML